MTTIEMAAAEADYQLMVNLQNYYDSVNSGSDSAFNAMVISTSNMTGLSAAIKTAWVGAISTSLATATATFNATAGTAS